MGEIKGTKENGSSPQNGTNALNGTNSASMQPLIDEGTEKHVQCVLKSVVPVEDENVPPGLRENTKPVQF